MDAGFKLAYLHCGCEVVAGKSASCLGDLLGGSPILPTLTSPSSSSLCILAPCAPTLLHTTPPAHQPPTHSFTVSAALRLPPPDRPSNHQPFLRHNLDSNSFNPPSHHFYLTTSIPPVTPFSSQPCANQHG